MESMLFGLVTINLFQLASLVTCWPLWRCVAAYVPARRARASRSDDGFAQKR